MLMLADHDSGMILGVDLLNSPAIHGSHVVGVPAIVVEKLADNFPPNEIQ
jgi:hypothetical protein